jgi:crotonobetainyl-CoA:carnitine CoA-transferase CaiB-like acyl-CoA transferase
MSSPYGPLQGVKVVSCSTAQAGTVPYMLMADLGADVIKIEVPEGGDGSRRMTVLPGMPSTFFETNNRGVKSVTLNLKAAEGRAILHKLVAKADIFGQNFRPGAAEKNGFGWEELRKINPKLVYVSISGYGTKGPNGHLPGTDSMAQALGGIAEAYSMPGQKMRTGIASVADESTAMLAFGGALAALTHARTTGVGQKIELSLLGSLIRLMGWTFTTTMWRNKNPVTGQARITGTPQRAGISASFNDRDGKPLVFQLTGPDNWKDAMSGLGFHDRIKVAGFEDLGVIIDNDAKRNELLALLDDLFADQHHAGSDQRARRAGQRLRHRDRLPQARQAPEGARHALAVLRDAGQARHRAGTGRSQRCGAGRAGLQPRRGGGSAGTADHLSQLAPAVSKVCDFQYLV